MRVVARAVTAGLVLAGLVTVIPTAADDDGKRFQVIVTNLTRGQQFTPILVASHRGGPRLFEVGHPASSELAILAEEGDTGPLAAALAALPAVRDVVTSGGLLGPGQSVTITVQAGEGADHVSVAAMLIPTNDGFFALDGVPVPRGRRPATFYSPAYDAGSERNDETCASIPGPFFSECGGPGVGGQPAGDEEGYVHIHAGIHGIGDLVASARDWRNPVARVTVQRIP